MHHGKFEARRKKPRFHRPLFLILTVAVLLLCLVGGAVALMKANTNTVENEFTYGHVSCRVEEAFDGTRKTDVAIVNAGDTAAYVRAKVIITWKNADGEVFGQAPTASDYVLEYGAQWTELNGTWYFNGSVAPSGKTAPLILSCVKANDAAVPEGYDLSVEVIAEALQSEPAAAVQGAWGASFADGVWTEEGA